MSFSKELPGFIPNQPADRDILPDSLGIHWQGPVVAGHLSIADAAARQKRAAAKQQPSLLPDLGPGVHPSPPPAAVPPPTAAETVLDIPAQWRRKDFGVPTLTHYTNPGQYDPVLRWHLRMPDPYYFKK